MNPPAMIFLAFMDVHELHLSLTISKTYLFVRRCCARCLKLRWPATLLLSAGWIFGLDLHGDRSRRQRCRVDEIGCDCPERSRAPVPAMAVAASISGSPRGGLLVTRCTPSPVRTPVSGLRERKLETARCRVHARRAAPRRDTLIGWCVGISMARIGLRYSTSRSLRPGSSVDAVPARPQTVCYAGAAGGSTGPRHLIFPTPFVRFLGVTGGDPISCTNNLTLRSTTPHPVEWSALPLS